MSVHAAVCVAHCVSPHFSPCAGLQIGLKLLRAGATLLLTTRFPVNCVDRYSQEADFAEWSHRLRVYGLDLRDVARLEAFAAHVKAT